MLTRPSKVPFSALGPYRSFRHYAVLVHQWLALSLHFLIYSPPLAINPLPQSLTAIHKIIYFSLPELPLIAGNLLFRNPFAPSVLVSSFFYSHPFLTCFPCPHETTFRFDPRSFPSLPHKMETAVLPFHQPERSSVRHFSVPLLYLQ